MHFFNRFWLDFVSEIGFPNLEKSLNSIGKIGIFCFLRCFNIRSLLDTISVSNWIHFCIKNPAKSRLGGVLGRLGGILGGLGCILGGPERHLGDYCMFLNGLGRFQNALGTFQKALERER